MSVTCIVCLGDLGESAPVIATESVPRHDHDRLVGPEDSASAAGSFDGTDNGEDPGQIARLLPCLHILHNNCLKPWVERANSCPICRQSFNIVELIDQVGGKHLVRLSGVKLNHLTFLIVFLSGPVTSSYFVEDRVQVADLDPSMIVDYVDDDSDSHPCPICGDSDNEELLMLCDGCDLAWHTYCIGLDSVPSGIWFCEHCETQHALGALSDSVQADGPPRGRRTRAQQRRMQNRNQVNSFHWARVWQSVWDRLNLDLDFPFEDDTAAERLQQQLRREAANEREFHSWQQRFRNTERLRSDRLRDTAALLARPSRPRVPRAPSPEPESLEEMRAWNAFERAREIERNPGAASRKRKEPTISPSPEPTEPERKLKRPRTRRPQELAALAMRSGGESSRTASVQASARINAETSSEPSFLQSLLREVEEASVPSSHAATAEYYGLQAQAQNGATELSSSGPTSPSNSPSPSNHSSPRPSPVSSPPPYVRGCGPISPVQLTPLSRPSSPPFSPNISPFSPPSSTTQQQKNGTPENKQQQADFAANRPRQSRHSIARRSAAHENGASSSNEGSPTRSGLSFTVKLDIQRLVGAALKPHYRAKVVSKDEYTEINRMISRRLYDRVGDSESVEDGTKASLEQAANEEVRGAVAHLKRQKKRERGKGGGGKDKKGGNGNDAVDASA